ncbi:Cell morphogenesis protein PAG1 [Coemansia sp. RSA 2336]|nr:Cell morphogenesis protein PAG1 [Coemansia sp. RSA 2336]
MSGEPQNTDIDSKVLQDLAKHFHTPTQLTGFSHLNIADTSSSSPSTSIAMDPSTSGVPINFSNRQMGSSFGTDYERSGLAGSFQQLQHNSFQQTPQQQQQSLFRAQLGSSAQQEMFSPGTDDLGDLSPASSYPSHSLAAMASGAIPSSIPGTLLSNQRQAAQVATDHMLRMQAFSASPPPTSPGFQSMSLPAHSEWFENQLVQQQSIGSALDPSSFTAQQIAGSSAAEFSPQNQTLMSLMENDDADVQKVMEKRRRRRESHNAVERRRRDNINDRIHELYELLPESIIDLSVKPNKGVILKKSVEYIHQLNQIIQSQSMRIQELESGLSSSVAQQQQQHQQQPQASSGLAAMLAGAAGINTSRPQGSDANMMNSGL